MVTALLLLMNLYSIHGGITSNTKKSHKGLYLKSPKPEGRFSKVRGEQSGGDGRAGKVLIVHEVGEYAGHVISGGHGGGHGGHGGGHGGHGGGHGGHGGGHSGHGSGHGWLGDGHGAGHGGHGGGHGWLGGEHGAGHGGHGGGHGG
ncbi:unnamed protein product, partial [Larinioides sclopetarius]